MIEVLARRARPAAAARAAPDRRAGAVLSPRCAAATRASARRSCSPSLYIDERLSRRIPKKDLASKTALRLVSEIPGLQIKDARQTLTIGTADVETAERLDIPLNAPVAILHRSVVDRAGCLVFTGEGIYRGDAVRIDMKLK